MRHGMACICDLPLLVGLPEIAGHARMQRQANSLSMRECVRNPHKWQTTSLRPVAQETITSFGWLRHHRRELTASRRGPKLT